MVRRNSILLDELPHSVRPVGRVIVQDQVGLHSPVICINIGAQQGQEFDEVLSFGRVSYHVS